jgi:hypothetical protein
MSQPLNDREIELIEQLGIYKRLLEVHKLIETVLVVRLGGSVVLNHAELEHNCKEYILSENIKVEDYTADIHMQCRLR